MSTIVPKLRFFVKQRLLKELRRCRSAGLRVRYLIVLNLSNGRSAYETDAVLVGGCDLWFGDTVNEKARITNSHHWKRAVSPLIPLRQILHTDQPQSSERIKHRAALGELFARFGEGLEAGAL